MEKTDSVVYIKATKSELLRKVVYFVEEAYEMYNEYAFRKGFGIRLDVSKWRKDGSLSKKRFVCANEGFKDDKRKNRRSYEKLDVRTDCSAFVRFHIDHKGVWTCKRHDMVHNHDMIPLEKRHLIRSHRLF